MFVLLRTFRQSKTNWNRSMWRNFSPFQINQISPSFGPKTFYKSLLYIWVKSKIGHVGALYTRRFLGLFSYFCFADWQLFLILGITGYVDLRFCCFVFMWVDIKIIQSPWRVCFWCHNLGQNIFTRWFQIKFTICICYFIKTIQWIFHEL